MDKLKRLEVRCSVCPQTPRYEYFEQHELTHFNCQVCNEQLSGWDQIADHLYLKCPKTLVECKHCVFKFPREKYAAHNCKKHYLLRAAESAFFGLTFLALAFNGKIIHRLPIAECSSQLTLVRNLMSDFLINHLVVLWALAMWFNMYSVQKKK